MGNNGVPRIGEIIASDKYATLKTAINQGFEKINSTYGDKIVDDKNKGIAVESNPNNEPENKPDSVSLKNKKRYERMIKGYIIENGFEDIKEKINASPDKVYTTNELSEDGEEDITVTFKLDDKGNITFEYLVTKKPNDEVKFDAKAQEKYNDLGKELTNPLTSKDRKEEIRKEMTELLEQQYINTVHTKGFGGRNKPFLDPNYKKRAKATVDMTERLAKFNGREVVPYSAATPAFYVANSELEAEKAEAQKRIDEAKKEGKEPSADDLAILNKSIGAISGISMSYVNHHKYLFYKDGKFDSEMFKDFAAVLAGEDGLLTVEERKSAENRFMMRASEAARKAQQKLKDNGGDASTLTQEEKDLITFAMDYKQQPFKTRKAIFEAPLGMVQASIVRDAGLDADTNYKPLLTAASIVAAVAAPYIGAALTNATVGDIKLNLKTLIENNVVVNATDTVNYYIDEVAGQIIVENITQGTVETITDVTLKGLIEGTVKTSLSGIAVSNPIAFGAGALVDKNASPAQSLAQQEKKEQEQKINGNGAMTDPCPPENTSDGVDNNGKVDPPGNNNDGGCGDKEPCDCEETLPITIPKAKNTGRTEKNSKGEDVIVYQGLLDKDILDCFKVAEGENEGKSIPREQFKAFIKAYREAKLGGKNHYLGSGNQVICTEFTFNNVKYKFNEAAFDKLLNDFKLHPEKYEYHGGGKNIKAVKLDEKPC